MRMEPLGADVLCLDFDLGDGELVFGGAFEMVSECLDGL